MEQIYLEDDARVWMQACDKGGVSLTPEVAAAREAWEDADKEVKSLPRPDEPVSPARLIDQGWKVDDAQEEFDNRYQAVVEWKRRHNTLVDARSLKARVLNKSVASSLDALVIGTRPVVTEIIDLARPHAEKLVKFGPEYDPAVMVAKATSTELKAYQEILQLQARFDTIHHAWARSYANMRRLSAAYVTGHHGDFGWSALNTDPAHFVWSEPSLVREPRLNGQARSRNGYPLAPRKELLLIALEDPECGYRFATFDDLRERAYEEWQARRLASRTGTQRGRGMAL